MIDIENDVYSTVAAALREAYPGIFVVNEDLPMPSKFPAVSIVEADNRIVQNMRTLSIENAALVMYEVNIFSAKSTGKKTEAKTIRDTVDGLFESMGFTRTMGNQISNFNDTQIYRIVCRYEATIGHGENDDFLVYHN